MIGKGGKGKEKKEHLKAVTITQNRKFAKKLGNLDWRCEMKINKRLQIAEKQLRVDALVWELILLLQGKEEINSDLEEELRKVIRKVKKWRRDIRKILKDRSVDKKKLGLEV